jgi:hypothetical protein
MPSAVALARLSSTRRKGDIVGSPCFGMQKIVVIISVDRGAWTVKTGLFAVHGTCYNASI